MFIPVRCKLHSRGIASFARRSLGCTELGIMKVYENDYFSLFYFIIRYTLICYQIPYQLVTVQVALGPYPAYPVTNWTG